VSKVQDGLTDELPVSQATGAAEQPQDDILVATPVPPSRPETPDDPPEPPPMSTRRLVVTGLVIVLALLATFAAYELWFGGLLESRSQAQLLAEFKKSLVLDDTPALVTPPEGHPVAVVEIPRLGGEQVLVQGIGSDDTKMGPGHDPASPAPGQAGNVVIIGRRTTYGAPFQHLSAMQPGDSVIATTRQGQFTYSVESIHTVPLGDTSVVAATTDDRMTLITSASAYRPGNELVVVAKLQGKGLQAPGPLPLRPLGERPGRSTLLNGRWGAILLWGELFALTLAVTLYLYRRRWSPAVTYLLTTPILITLAVLFFRAVDTLLPPTL
jgi:sortase A